MLNRIYIVLGIFLLTLGYTFYQSYKLQDRLAPQDIAVSNSVLTEIPDALFQEYKSNEVFKIQELYKTHNLVIHFWASWCAPCEKEFPELLSLANKLQEKENLKFIFVIVNDEVSKVDKFLAKQPKLSKNIILVMDNNNVHQRSFGTYRLPETYVFGQVNNLIRRFSGAQSWDSAFFNEFLKNL